MDRKTAILLFFLCSHIAFSQSRFSISPNPNSLTFSYDTTDVVCYSWLKNLTTDTLFMKWKRVKNVTSPWTTTICDPVTCWIPKKDSAEFKLMPEQDSARFWIHFYPDSTVKEDSAIYMVWEISRPESPLKVVFHGKAVEVMAVSEKIQSNLFKIIPNPSGDKIFIQTNEDIGIKNLRVFDMLGKYCSFSSENNQWINVGHLPKGIYLIQVTNKKGASVTGKFIRQ